MSTGGNPDRALVGRTHLCKVSLTSAMTARCRSRLKNLECAGNGLFTFPHAERHPPFGVWRALEGSYERRILFFSA